MYPSFIGIDFDEMTNNEDAIYLIEDGRTINCPSSSLLSVIDSFSVHIIGCHNFSSSVLVCAEGKVLGSVSLVRSTTLFFMPPKKKEITKSKEVIRRHAMKKG